MNTNGITLRNVHSKACGNHNTFARSNENLIVHHSLNNILWDKEMKLLQISDETAARGFTELLLSGNVQTAGGRVLTVVASAPTLTQARDLVYRNVAYVNFNGMHYRKDIALPPSPGAGGDGRPALPPAR